MADENPTQKAEDPAAEAATAEQGGAAPADARNKEGLDALHGREAELESEVAALKDRLLRALAEGENDRRRAARDREDAAKYGGTRLARDILSVYDNLERAVNSADEATRAAAKDFFDGVELTRSELIGAFAKHQIEPIDTSLGVKFDPNLHQAMFEAVLPGVEPGAVIQTMQTGFTIAGRLLRPAFVGVAKAGPSAPPPKAAEQPAAEASAEASAVEEGEKPADSAPDAERSEAEAVEAEPVAPSSGRTPPPPPPRPGAARTRRD